MAEQLSPAIRSATAAATSTWSIFFATETGSSRHIAELLAERSRDAGLVVELNDLRDYRHRALSKVQNALFVVATHGPPEPGGNNP